MSTAKSKIKGSVGSEHAHESAHLHVSGEARYVDDIREPRGTLYVAIGCSEKAHARIKTMDLTAVLAAPGVVDVLTASDVPGTNNHGPVVADDPLFADALVEYQGQSIFAVIARSVGAARRAARMAKIDYEELEPILSIEDALENESYVIPTINLDRGDSSAALAISAHRLQGQLSMGGQDHFYLEGQVALALPKEDGDMLIYSSTQHPTEGQHLVAHALNKQSKDIVVECRRMGGGFGGKETQPALLACIAAVAAQKTGHPVKCRLDRDEDMIITGKRHGFLVDYDVGFNETGLIEGIDFMLASNCGRSADLSGPVNDRAVFHSDNCYFLENIHITSHRCKTHTVSNTAFRGFGGPQGMMAIEYVIDEIARHLKKDPLDIRKVNFYGIDERNVTPYQMTVEDNIIHRLVDELETKSEYQKRRAEIASYNKTSPILKRGLALTPVKFGISFTATFFNQAGALINVYRDGSVILNHGGTEMGQGLYTKVAQVVAEEFQLDIGQIKCSATDTSKVPNTSATAASSGSDLNGMAAKVAAKTIKDRLVNFVSGEYGVPVESVIFQNGEVHIGSDKKMSFAELTERAYMARISLSSSGYYRTPKIKYDPASLSGRPFFYFSYGAAVSEVVIDTLTGEHKVLRVDILHDVGASLNPAIDMGQVEGGFIQGMGWLTSEELVWNESGRLTTHAPSTYKIPVCSDLPQDFNVELVDWSENREETVYRSKAVGEPPFMLGISVFHAIKDAVESCGDYKSSSRINAPATAEEVLNAISRVNEAVKSGA
ncbi:MAG: xanthine dehydrogenase molybdopterin binding subunit [Gammaproteobacteria bacterium]|nr:xanthine dehydrogenase molybdopterin binding subunit [Gammaproteobacteria bacterium]